MYDYIQIATINDFVFCPRSVYFHSIYYQFDDDNYKARPQKEGALTHAASDAGRYSTRARYLQGMEVFSHKLGLIGKIDIYDQEDKVLIERKTRVVRIYEGYKYQLYAQKACLREMGYEIKNMVIHSLADNKKYPISQNMRDEFLFLRTLERMRTFDIATSVPLVNSKKCHFCIYRALCKKDDSTT